jgi:hypothetical protein
MEDSAKGRANRPARDDATSLDNLIGRPIGEALRNWIEADRRAAAALRQAEPLAAIPLSDSEVRLRRFAAPAQPDNVRLRSPEGWDSLDLPDKPIVYHASPVDDADRVVQDRIIAFLNLLRAGELQAKSPDGDLPAVYWGRSDGQIYVENSDLEIAGGRTYRGVTIGWPEPAANKTGPHKKTGPKGHDWDAVMKILLGIANSPDGLPENQAEIVRRVQEAYAQSHNGVDLGESTIKQKLKLWLPDNFRSGLT